jgi:hypothetical protein
MKRGKGKGVVVKPFVSVEEIEKHDKKEKVEEEKKSEKDEEQDEGVEEREGGVEKLNEKVEKKRMRGSPSDMTRVVNVRVAELRKMGFASLEEWLKVSNVE